MSWRGREDWLVEKCRDVGLSWLCVAVAVWMFLFQPGTVVGFGSRKEEYVDKLGDPKALFWKIRTFIDLLPAEFRPAGWNSDKHAPFMRVINPETGAAIVGEAGDNIGRGNRTSIYFWDESAFYERPEKIDAALSQTSNCKGDVSTPNGEGNPFWKKRFGGRIPVFVFDWRDDPRKGPSWYEQQKSTLTQWCWPRKWTATTRRRSATRSSGAMSSRRPRAAAPLTCPPWARCASAWMWRALAMTSAS